MPVESIAKCCLFALCLWLWFYRAKVLSLIARDTLAKKMLVRITNVIFVCVCIRSCTLPVKPRGTQQNSSKLRNTTENSVSPKLHRYTGKYIFKAQVMVVHIVSSILRINSTKSGCFLWFNEGFLHQKKVQPLVQWSHRVWFNMFFIWSIWYDCQRMLAFSLLRNIRSSSLECTE